MKAEERAREIIEDRLVEPFILAAQREAEDRMRGRCLEEVRNTYRGTSVSDIRERSVLSGVVSRIIALPSEYEEAL